MLYLYKERFIYIYIHIYIYIYVYYVHVSCSFDLSLLVGSIHPALLHAPDSIRQKKGGGRKGGAGAREAGTLIWVDLERGAKNIFFSSEVVGFQPLNHNKQQCKMFPNDNHVIKT